MCEREIREIGPWAGYGGQNQLVHTWSCETSGVHLFVSNRARSLSQSSEEFFYIPLTDLSLQ